MTQNNTNDNGHKQSALSKIVDVLTLLLITALISVFCFLVFKYFNKEDNNVVNAQHIKTLNDNLILPKKSINDKTNTYKLDSLTYEFKLQYNNIKDDLYNLHQDISQVKVNNDELENKLKLIAALIGLVFAVLGFFGFKSMHEFRDYSIKITKQEVSDIAKITAKEAAIAQAKETASEQSSTVAKEKASEIAKGVAETVAREQATKTANNISEEILKEKVGDIRFDLKEFKKLIREFMERTGNDIEVLKGHLKNSDVSSKEVVVKPEEIALVSAVVEDKKMDEDEKNSNKNESDNTNLFKKDK